MQPNQPGDKGQLFSKVVYIYFCFFSMAVAERFSMSITYGAALYVSLSALFQTSGFMAKTTYDSRLQRGIKTATVVFFSLSTVYIIFIYPFLFTYQYMVYTIAIIVLPLVERETENFLLRRRAKSAPLEKHGIIKTILPVEIIFVAVISLASLVAGGDVFAFVISGAVIGMGLCFFRQVVFRDYLSEYPCGAEPGDLTQIRSARLYDGMVITSGAALNIFAFTYILYFVFLRASRFFFGFFAIFGVLSLIFTAVYLGTYRGIRSSLIQKIGKNAAYILGTAVCIFAVYVFRESWVLSPFAFLVQTLLLLFGLMLQMTATLGLKEDVLLVVRLHDKDIGDDALGERTARLGHWTSVISETVVLAVLLLLISDPLYYMMNVEGYIVYAPYIGSSVIIIPTTFLIISLVCSIKQPITKKFSRLLKAYTDLKNRGKENPDMEKRLKNVLIKKYKKRIGVYIIRAFLKPVMYHTVTGEENVSRLPGVFVFNHGEIYGPIAAMVFLPYDVRPWILDSMLDKKETARHMYEGTFSKIRWLPSFLGRFIAKAISPVVVWALCSFEPIPVYRGKPRSVIKTFSLSIECLNAGDSILLFPENPEETYQEEVSAFYTGFANLGRLYYKKDGKKLTFYPVYASKRHRVLRIGAGVQYVHDNGKEEKGRIVKLLEVRMRDLQSMDDE
ncbi:MAG: hypothetical protein PHO15_01480 [Eubacteriales bacterium]|nr:hypothetical protein [Eubacteriales bacterium]